MSPWDLSPNRSTVADSVVRYQYQSGCPAVGLAAHAFVNDFVLGTFFRLPQLPVDSERLHEQFARKSQLTEWFSQTKSQSIETLIILRHCPEYNASENLAEPKIGPRTTFGSSMEMILSIQTSLLDAQPIDVVEFELPWLNPSEISTYQTQLTEGEKFSHQLHGLNAAEFQNDFIAGTLVVHSSDLKSLDVDSGTTGSRVIARLRCQNLEKGVIRRFRMFLAFVPLAERHLLREMANAFEGSQLPLST
ncbi:MAG: hypothetical protein ABL888_06300 [Pirellulaceae bacterium]